MLILPEAMNASDSIIEPLKPRGFQKRGHNLATAVGEPTPTPESRKHVARLGGTGRIRSLLKKRQCARKANGKEMWKEIKMRFQRFQFQARWGNPWISSPGLGLPFEGHVQTCRIWALEKRIQRERIGREMTLNLHKIFKIGNEEYLASIQIHPQTSQMSTPREEFKTLDFGSEYV